MGLIGESAVAEFIKASPSGLKKPWIGQLFWLLLRTLIQMVIFKYFWNQTISPIFGVAQITLKDAFMLSTFVGLLSA